MMAIANHELDALIAEKVMGWAMRPMFTDPDRGDWVWVKDYDQIGYECLVEDYIPQIPEETYAHGFCPSEDIADAILVLPKLHEMYKRLFPGQMHERYVNIHLIYRPGLACCGAMGDWGRESMGWMDEDHVACSSTLSRAICLAALNALEALERQGRT